MLSNWAKPFLFFYCHKLLLCEQMVYTNALNASYSLIASRNVAKSQTSTPSPSSCMACNQENRKAKRWHICMHECNQNADTWKCIGNTTTWYALSVRQSHKSQAIHGYIFLCFYFFSERLLSFNVLKGISSACTLCLAFFKLTNNTNTITKVSNCCYWCWFYCSAEKKNTSKHQVFAFTLGNQQSCWHWFTVVDKTILPYASEYWKWIHSCNLRNLIQIVIF